MEKANGTGKFDLLLCGGHVIDPANHVNDDLDVALNDGKVALVAKGIPHANAKKVVDVSGCYVTPGIVDIHSHVYPMMPMPEHSLPCIHGDAHMFQAGVTTTVDAGTTGYRDFLDFKQNVIDKSKLRILAFINIASCGMIDMRSEQTLADLQPKAAAGLAASFPDLIVGIKTAHYWGSKPFDDLHPAWASVDRTIEAGELCGKPAMIDFHPNLPLCPYSDLVTKKMRPGDMHTHVYAQHIPTLDSNGKVLDYMRAARERGVLFDLGHGGGSFWFRNAIPAFKDGFGPDSLSTDLHMGNIHGSVQTMLNVMSKYVNIGMPLEEVILRSTALPAKFVNHPELGTLSVGSCADVAVIRKLDGAYDYIDCGNTRMRGNSKLDCMMTIRGGEVVFDPNGLSMPDWENAPAAYWTSPGRV